MGCVFALSNALIILFGLLRFGCAHQIAGGTWTPADVQFAVDVPVGGFRDIAAGPYFGCVLNATGHVGCFGSPVEPSMLAWPRATRFSSLAVSVFAVCGLRAVDARIQCWGNSRYAKAPAGEFDIIASGEQFACAQRIQPREVVCWPPDKFAWVAPQAKFTQLAHGCARHMWYVPL